MTYQMGCVREKFTPGTEAVHTKTLADEGTELNWNGHDMQFVLLH